MDEDQKFGLEGIEQSQGFERMPVAHPAPSTDDLPTDSTMTESELAHFKRPEPEPPVDRSYRDGSGNEMDDKYSVTAEQASSDLQRTRDIEAQAREDLAAQDLRAALDATEQPAQQDQQPQQLDELQPETAEAEAARAEVDGAWAKADAEITEFLKDPHIRERIQGEYDQIKQTAAAEAKAEVERAYNLSAAAQNHYTSSVNNLANEANALVGALYPELEGLNAQQVQGALMMMAKNQPQRVQALQQLASRAQGIMEAQVRQNHQAAQGQALQREHELQQFTAVQEKQYEEAVKYESPETMKAVRSQVYDVTEKAYGISKETMGRLYSGEQRVDSAAFVRSAAFQLMLTDAVKYRLSKQGITQARSNPVPRVQRPGVTSDGPKVHEGDLAAAASRFNLPGGNVGTQGLRNAAAWVTAKRGARG